MPHSSGFSSSLDPAVCSNSKKVGHSLEVRKVERVWSLISRGCESKVNGDNNLQAPPHASGSDISKRFSARCYALVKGKQSAIVLITFAF